MNITLERTSSNDLPLYKKHSAQVTRLDVNHDGTMLASGDAAGNCIIWDILSQQCLRNFSLKGYCWLSGKFFAQKMF